MQAKPSSSLCILPLIALALLEVSRLSLFSNSQPWDREQASSDSDQIGRHLGAASSLDKPHESRSMQSVKHSFWNVIEWESDPFASKCYYVENLCHGMDGQWFYRRDAALRQPQLTLQRLEKTYRNGKAANHSEYKVGSVSPDEASHLRCSDSPVENHLVLFSLYNSMLGEFYVRGLYFLWRVYQSFPDLVRSSQLYIHSHDPSQRTLLESHHLFTQAFRTRPLLDFASALLDDRSSCQCMKRVIFCGYHQRHNAVGSLDTPWSARATTAITLEPGGRALPKAPSHGFHTLYAEFRDHLRHNAIGAEARDGILRYRRKVMESHNIPSNQWGDDRWIIVGLAQRSGRRKWLHLDAVLKAAQAALLGEKFLFDIVNLDEEHSTAFDQVVAHGALDALIGIHGAQLTEAVWMKPGATVIELLPYVPSGVDGGWTKRTDQPTPLGIIFHNTDLQHFGFALSRDSAPYCLENSSNDLNCWQTKHPWDGRDFELTSEALEMLVRRLLIHQPTRCSDLIQQIGNEIVPYNVVCDGEDGKRKPHHYYKVQDHI